MSGKDKNWVRVSALRAACASGIPHRSNVGSTDAQDDRNHAERILDRAADFESWLTRDDNAAIAEANLVDDMGADDDLSTFEYAIRQASDDVLRDELSRRHPVASTPNQAKNTPQSEKDQMYVERYGIKSTTTTPDDREPYFDNIEGVSSATSIYVKCTSCAWRLRTANNPDGVQSLSGFAAGMFNVHVCARHPRPSIADRS